MLRSALLLAALFGAVIAASLPPTGEEQEATTAPAEATAESPESSLLTNLGITPEELTSRRQAIKSYFHERYGKLDVIDETTSPTGQKLLWIYPDIIAPGGVVRTPPPASLLRSRPSSPARDSEKDVADDLKLPPESRGPPGTVPILAYEDEKIDQINPGPTVADFLSKYGSTQDRPQFFNHSISQRRRFRRSPYTHMLAYTEHDMDNYGGEGHFNVWNSYTYQADEVSLVEMVASNEDGLETVEVGIQEHYDRYADYDPHLFIYFTTNGGTSEGNDIGGYNDEVDGFVQTSSSYYPGMSISPTSSVDGTQYSLYLGLMWYDSDWWVMVGEDWLGYYPGSLFNSTLMRTKATFLHVFGDVLDDDDDSIPTYTDMGSGIYANEGYERAAYVRSIFLFDTSWYYVDYDATDEYATDAGCYSLDTYWLDLSSFESHFYYGGPGNSVNC